MTPDSVPKDLPPDVQRLVALVRRTKHRRGGGTAKRESREWGCGEGCILDGSGVDIARDHVRKTGHVVTTVVAIFPVRGSS